MPGTHAPINLILFEYQGCAKGFVRRQNEPFPLTPYRKPVLPMQGFRSRQIGDGKAHGVQRDCLAIRLDRDTEEIARRRWLQDLDRKSVV